MMIKSHMIEKIVLYVIATVMSLSIATVTFFARATYDQLQSVSTQMTGHIIQHGKSDIEQEILMDAVNNLGYNQFLICKYAEQNWPTHDRCRIFSIKGGS